MKGCQWWWAALLPELFLSAHTAVLPGQRANSHKVFRTLGRKFAFQSTCFCCYQAPLQNLSGDGSVLENIDFFILSRGGKSLCVNKIREHVQWKHTWSIKHNVKQLLLKCHSKPGPQTRKKKKRKKLANRTICLVCSREETPLHFWSKEFQTFPWVAWSSRHHIDSCLCESRGLGSKYLTSNTYGNTFPPLLGYITSLLPSNSQTISCFKTNVLTTCVPLGWPASSARCCCCCGIVSIFTKVNTTSLHPISAAHVTPFRTMFALPNPVL